MIDIPCACGESYHAEESHIGRSLLCWKCGATLSVERGAPISPSHPSGVEHVTSPATGEHPSHHATISTSGRRCRGKAPAVGGVLLAVCATVLFLFGRWSKTSSEVKLGPSPTPKQAASLPPIVPSHGMAGSRPLTPNELARIGQEAVKPDYLSQSAAEKVERIRRVAPSFREWKPEDQLGFVSALDGRLRTRRQRFLARTPSAATAQTPPTHAGPGNLGVVQSSNSAGQPMPLPPCAQNQQVVRLPTGAKIEPGEGASGPCKLKISNGTSHDAAVRVVDEASSRTARFVYVQAGDDYTLDGIEPGAYQIRWISGYDWVPACRDFLREAGYSEADRALWFKVEVDDYSRPVSATRHEITLYPVLGGNLGKRAIDRKRFFEGDQYVSPKP